MITKNQVKIHTQPAIPERTSKIEFIKKSIFFQFNIDLQKELDQLINLNHWKFEQLTLNHDTTDTDLVLQANVFFEE